MVLPLPGQGLGRHAASVRAAQMCSGPGREAESRAERAATACQKKTRMLGCGAIHDPDCCYPCLASLRPGHTRCRCQHTGELRQEAGAPLLVRALARHDVAPRGCSHFGSPLVPGRPVLTLGVSRRRRISGLCSCRRLTERGAQQTLCRLPAPAGFRQNHDRAEATTFRNRIDDLLITVAGSGWCQRADSSASRSLGGSGLLPEPSVPTRT